LLVSNSLLKILNSSSSAIPRAFFSRQLPRVRRKS
jgi:hypothetical protein